MNVVAGVDLPGIWNDHEARPSPKPLLGKDEGSSLVALALLTLKRKSVL